MENKKYTSRLAGIKWKCLFEDYIIVRCLANYYSEKMNVSFDNALLDLEKFGVIERIENE